MKRQLRKLHALDQSAEYADSQTEEAQTRVERIRDGGPCRQLQTALAWIFIFRVIGG